MTPLEEAYARLLAARAELDRLRLIAAVTNEGDELNLQHYIVANLEREIIAIKGAPTPATTPSNCPYG
jgi:hypothetical protein